MFLRKITNIAVLSALSGTALQLPAYATSLESPTRPSCVFPAEAGALSLQDAVEYALCNHPETRAAAARLGIAQALSGQARAALAPQITGSGTSTQAKFEDNPSARTSQAQLRMSYVLFDFGRRQAAAEASRATSLAAELDSQAAAQAIILTTAERYFSLLSAQQSEETAQAALAAAKLGLDAVTARYSTGLAPKVEMLQARSRVAEAELSAVRSRSAVAVASAALAQQIGQRASTKVEALALPTPSNASFPGLAQLMEDALQNRPEAKAARQRLEAAQAQQKAASAQSKPTITFNAAGNRNVASPATTGTQFSAGLAVEIPLFDGGLAKSQRSQARAQAELATAELDARLQSVELNVVQAHAQLSTAQQAYTSADSFLKTAEEAEDQAAGRYRAGVGTLTDWLDAQAKLTSARQQRTSALLDWHTATLALARAVGSLTATNI